MIDQQYYRFNLPFPPSVNHAWKHRAVKGRAQVYLSAKGQAFRSSVINKLIAHCRKPLSGRISVTLSIYPPNARKFDIDNRIKAVLDALTHAGIWHDDEQVDVLTVRRCEKDPDKQGYVEVVVVEL